MRRLIRSRVIGIKFWNAASTCQFAANRCASGNLTFRFELQIASARTVRLLRILCADTRRSLEVSSVRKKSSDLFDLPLAEYARHQSSPLSTSNKSENRFAVSTMANHRRLGKSLAKFKAFGLFTLLEKEIVLVKNNDI